METKWAHEQSVFFEYLRRDFKLEGNNVVVSSMFPLLPQSFFLARFTCRYTFGKELTCMDRRHLCLSKWVSRARVVSSGELY